MKEYKAYNGYYIGTGANDFKSKEEIDAFHLERAKKTYEQACRLFNKYGTMEASEYAGKQMLILHDIYGVSWEEIEQIELSTYCTND